MPKCRVHVDLRLCKGCGICVELCPKQALRLSSGLSERGYRYPELVGECIGCGTCMMFCPDFAISVECGEVGGGGSA